MNSVTPTLSSSTTADPLLVKAFWDRQAEIYGSKDTATAPDSHYRTLEINRILPHIDARSKVIDVGCGNGFSTRTFARRVSSSSFLGIDY